MPSVPALIADCASIETRSVPIQGVVDEAYTYKTEVPVYGYKKFYRDRTRSELLRLQLNIHGVHIITLAY